MGGVTIASAQQSGASGRAEPLCASKLVLLGTGDAAPAGARNRETKRGGGLLIDLSARF
jgi:hypothetical protein